MGMGMGMGMGGIVRLRINKLALERTSGLQVDDMGVYIGLSGRSLLLLCI